MSSDPRSQETKPQQTKPEPSMGLRLDMACDQFEQAWKAGSPPLIEDYIKNLPEEQQWAVLRELVGLDAEYRRKRGEEPTAADYIARFPKHAALLPSIFREADAQQKSVPHRLGDYELTEQIGRGGMGVVWKARQSRLQKTVAVKVLPEKLLDDDRALSRFQREIALIGQLDHPNIVRALDARFEGGVHFLVMEYVEGKDVEQLVRHHQPMPVAAACEIIRQAAIGLEHAYEHKLVHRDIKPSNLMVAKNGVVKVLDLGLARLHNEQQQQATRQLTQAGFAMGTVDYMAPEQWEDSSGVDIRADIYSLGCTLFYTLTGRVPYGGESFSTAKKKLMGHAVAPIPMVSQARTDCDEHLSELVARMMGKEAADRHQTPREVAEELAEFSSLTELREVLGHESVGSSGLTGTLTISDVGSSNNDTRKNRTRKSLQQRRTKLSQSKSKGQPEAEPWYTRRGFIGGAIGTAILAGGVLLGRRIFSSALSASERIKLAAHLATLPVMQGVPDFMGGWWFQSIPWMSPCLRAQIARRVLGTGHDVSKVTFRELLRKAWETNVDDYQAMLHKIGGKLKDELPSQVQRDTATQLFDLDSDRLSNAGYRQRLEIVVDQLKASTDATELHLLANLRHELTQRADNKLEKKDAAQAKAEAEAAYKLVEETYDKAIAAYGNTIESNPDEPFWPWLRTACLADRGYLYYHQNKYSSATTAFAETVRRSESEPAFQIASLAQEAESLKKFFTPHKSLERLKIAEQSLLSAGSSVELQKQHPMMAFLYDRLGWAQMEAWQLNDAIESFQASIALRNQLEQQKISKSKVTRLFSWQGLATAYHFLGNRQKSVEEFNALIKEINASHDKDVEERKHNAFGRRANADLFLEGAVYTDALKTLEAADVVARKQEFDQDTRAAYMINTSYYRVIALALAEPTGDVKTLLDSVKAQLNDPVIQQLVVGKDSTFSKSGQIAQALVDLRGTASEKAAARASLVKLANNRLDKEKITPYSIELDLFAIEQAMLAELEKEELRKVVGILHSIAGDVAGKNPGSSDHRAYFKRYFLVARDVLKKNGEMAELKIVDEWLGS